MPTIRIKRSNSNNAPASLGIGELAYSEVSANLFIGKTDSSIEIIAGAGTFAKLASPNFTGTPTAPTPAVSDNSNRLATTAFVKAQQITLTGDATGVGNVGGSIPVTLSNTGVTAGTYPKVTVDSKGRVTAGATLVNSDIPKTLDHTWITDFDTQVRTSRLDQMAAPTAAVDMNNQYLLNVPDPTADHHAANKAYVDTKVQGLSPKTSVRAATTANITLSGLQTVDGVSLNAGDRVLVMNQTDASENGVYIADTGAWSRSDDADTWDELVSAYFFVSEGTSHADSGYTCTIDAGGTLGTDDVTFSQFSGAGQITAGAGLTKSGNTLNVGAGDGIQVDADSVTVKLDGTTLTKSASGLKVTDNTFQPLDSDLTAVSNLSAGIATKVSDGNWAARTITGTANRIVITNGDGVSGNPTIDCGSDILDINSDIDGGTF